jgi:hypothetical protein
MQSAIRRSREDLLRQEVHRCLAILNQVLEFNENGSDTRSAISQINEVVSYRGPVFLASAQTILEIASGEVERLELLKTKLQWSRKDG